LILVNQRPLACTISILPSSTIFIGNLSGFQIKVSDALNGSLLPNLVVSLYEDTVLLDTTITNIFGEATCNWITTGSLGYRDLHLTVTETPTHSFWVSSSLQVLLRDTTAVSITSNSTNLYAGEAISIELAVNTETSPPPNGTAALYWDGAWQKDITITTGYGKTILKIQYAESSGEHLIIILFGQLDSPDIYHESQEALVITVRGVYLPSLEVTVDPFEIEDIYLQSTLQIRAQLSYTNGTHTSGLIANLTVHLLTQDTALIHKFTIITNITGNGQLTIPTPQPGIYTITVFFEGKPGYAPCQATTPFLVRYPVDRTGGLNNPLLVWSLIVMLLGLIIGVSIFLRQKKRLNDFLRHLPPSQSSLPESSQDLLQLLANQSPEPNSNDSLDDD
jgi:hypothetical protein